MKCLQKTIVDKYYCWNFAFGLPTVYNWKHSIRVFFVFPFLDDNKLKRAVHTMPEVPHTNTEHNHVQGPTNTFIFWCPFGTLAWKFWWPGSQIQWPEKTNTCHNTLFFVRAIGVNHHGCRTHGNSLPHAMKRKDRTRSFSYSCWRCRAYGPTHHTLPSYS